MEPKGNDMTLRVCPMRDAICPHGMDCPYVGEPHDYLCQEGWDTPIGPKGNDMADELTIDAIGAFVRQKRGTRGLRSAAAEIGVSPTTLCRIENGHIPDVPTLEKACKWLGYSLLLARLSRPSTAEAVADPASMLQRAEEHLCECGAAGSGEGHTDWCPWLKSSWRAWGDAVNASAYIPAAAELLKTPAIHKLRVEGAMMTREQVAEALLAAAPTHPSPQGGAEPAMAIQYRNEEAGFVEFVNEDRPYIVREIDGHVAIIVDMETRNVIGYRVYDTHPIGETGDTDELVERLKEDADDVERFVGLNAHYVAGNIRKAIAALTSPRDAANDALVREQGYAYTRQCKLRDTESYVQRLLTEAEAAESSLAAKVAELEAKLAKQGEIAEFYHGQNAKSEQRVAALVGALTTMRDRDNRNGSLPEAYREIIDAALASEASK